MPEYCTATPTCPNYALDVLGLVVCGEHATKDAWIHVACDAMRELHTLRRRVAALEAWMDAQQAGGAT